MNNIYKDFFITLNEYLITLEIDKKHKGIEGCSIQEIESIEKRKGNLPLAYKEYLKSIGKKFLFEFMDAENMAFDDLDYIEQFGKEVFETNQLKMERPFMVISERRNDYITLIYLDEGDNPKTWIMSEYWDSEQKVENLEIRTDSFTDLILGFFQQSLINFPFTFNFVTEEEKKEDKDVVKKRYINWFKNLKSIEEEINLNGSKNNLLIKKLNTKFLDYYRPNEATINTELNNFYNQSPDNRIMKWIKNVFQ
ncbi:SMI1/KNR4 family protein [Winogradskyella sp.]|uniref:SMI1/KNR4 family protein n=1 Tax=Winogradskyella sp. TaxID=1883156 RepID=UPI0026237A0E|nr:SMI1/KNR4 family protein [Winogradskyella sp.]